MTFLSGFDLTGRYKLLLLLFVIVSATSGGCGREDSDMSNEGILVSGEIIFEDGGPSFDGATVYVRLEDVSRVDAASIVVAEQIISKVTAADVPIHFRLTGEPLAERAAYIVTVHVDVDGSGVLSPGDYLTMESYPVTIQSEPQYIFIRVHPLP